MAAGGPASGETEGRQAVVLSMIPLVHWRLEYYPRRRGGKESTTLCCCRLTSVAMSRLIFKVDQGFQKPSRLARPLIPSGYLAPNRNQGSELDSVRSLIIIRRTGSFGVTFRVKYSPEADDRNE